MKKTPDQVEARLARIEQELAALKAAFNARQTGPWYRQIVGEFAGDEAYAEIIRLGRRIRSGKRKN